jgi:hypothetical protein
MQSNCDKAVREYKAFDRRSPVPRRGIDDDIWYLRTFTRVGNGATARSSQEPTTEFLVKAAHEAALYRNHELWYAHHA